MGSQMLMVAVGWQMYTLTGSAWDLGLVGLYQFPAQQALVPQLVPAHLLSRAMAFTSTGNQAAVIGGPALGGFLYVAGADVVYAVCAALFVVAALWTKWFPALGKRDRMQDK